MMREYKLERDDKGQPVKMIWLGDYEPTRPKTRAAADAEKLAEHERIYGKRPICDAAGD